MTKLTSLSEKDINTRKKCLKRPGTSVKDPYKTLPPIFSTKEDEQLEGYFVEEETGIQNGGVAMVAYAKMQFTRMTEAEREKFSNTLLKYCKLDTLAMVMIREEFNRLIRNYTVPLDGLAIVE